jgi:hypothetical protein
MSQQFINYGTFPDDPNADAIRMAFQKIQSNFDELYVGSSTPSGPVLSVISGTGITIAGTGTNVVTGGSTGDVTISASIPNIRLTSTQLQFTSRTGSYVPPIPNGITITNSNQVILIDIPETITISGNMTANTNLIGGNVLTTGNANISTLNVTGTSNLNAVGNVTITGGIAGQVLTTDGSGVLSWVSVAVAGLANGTSAVTIPTANGNVNTAVGGVANVFVITTTGANITGTATATGNITGANIVTAGVVSATGNISGGNISSTGLITATGNITGSNLITTGDVFATGNVSGGNINTTGVVSATGNVSGGNINTAGIVSATGNISGGNISIAGVAAVTGNITGGNLSVTGTTLTTDITSGANTTAGTITGKWSLSSGSTLQAGYADLAEYYSADKQYEPGTVVEFGGTHEVQICDNMYSTLVAGILTTKPAYVMNADIKCDYPVAIALQGRTPVKVLGDVTRGDILVSGGDGRACRGNNYDIKFGTILGKAITSFTGAEGIVEIMVGRY